jgi:CRISPR/Cas system CSM-associated protein Csm3 (group 7 of RAMP superfamily)
MIEVVEAAFTFSTPWHVGTGEESGITDAVVVRENGVPVIPGSHIKGLAREGALELLYGVVADSEQLVYQVFGAPPGGNPRNGSWNIGSARPIGEAQVRVRQHNRLDPDTRRVPDDVYFDSEVVLPGVPFSCRVRPLSQSNEPNLAVLCVGLLGLERIGKRRSRGWGSCTVAIRIVDRHGSLKTDVSIESVLDAILGDDQS